MAKPFAWSYSALDSFETCPRRHYLTKVSKIVQEQQGPALVWGNEVHKALEHRLQGRPLGERFAQFEPYAQKVITAAQGGKLEVETELCLNKNFRPTTYFGKDAWVRAKSDVLVLKGDKAFNGDWKTGKPKPNSDQLKLSAAMVFAVKPTVNTVINTFIWLGSEAPPTTEVFRRDEVAAIWQDFMPRVQRMEEAYVGNKYPPRPSGLCRQYCPVGRQHCEHCGS